MVPGSTIINQFPINNGYYTHVLKNPGKVSSLGFYLLKKLPPGYGGALYYSVPPY